RLRHSSLRIDLTPPSLCLFSIQFFFYYFFFNITTLLFFFFFFNDTATTEIYTLSLHDALPICLSAIRAKYLGWPPVPFVQRRARSEEHTSELQSRENLVCRLLLEKKKKQKKKT